MKSRIRLFFVAGALLSLIAGVALWSWDGKRAAVTGSLRVSEPSTDELRTFAAKKVFFGHQSVGANVINGVTLTFSALGLSAPSVVETREHVAVDGGFVAHAHVGVNGDPNGKFADFVAVMGGPLGDQVDVAMVKLCYADIVAGTDVNAVFYAYSAMMDDLARSHPSVELLYTTVPLSTDRGWKATIKSWIGQNDQMGPADNEARQRYNELIRARFGASGRLFDIAAIEATVSSSPTERTLDGKKYFVLNSALAADPGHLNDLGSRLVAADFIRLVARGGGPR